MAAVIEAEGRLQLALGRSAGHLTVLAAFALACLSVVGHSPGWRS